MLVHLQIRDLAVIDAAEFELEGGLTALTGETGAGKSIIVDAVMLALGGRASADALRHGAERAEITATFEAGANPAVQRWLEEQSIEADDGELVFRRVIGRDGRSRQYVNGQSLPAQSVRELGELPHRHPRPAGIRVARQPRCAARDRRRPRRRAQRLRRTSRCLPPSGDAAARSATRLRRRRRIAARGSNCCATRSASSRRSRSAPAKPRPSPSERNRLANRGRLAEAVQGALALCYEGDGADAHALAARAASQLRGAAALDARLEEPLARVEESLIALARGGSRLGAYLENLDADPARQEQVERRVAAIEDLARKHRVAGSALPGRSSTSCRATLADIEQSELTLGGLDERIAALTSAI